MHNISTARQQRDMISNRTRNSCPQYGTRCPAGRSDTRLWIADLRRQHSRTANGTPPKAVYGIDNCVHCWTHAHQPTCGFIYYFPEFCPWPHPASARFSSYRTTAVPGSAGRQQNTISSGIISDIHSLKVRRWHLYSFCVSLAGHRALNIHARAA